jgi:hypothetical protein
VDESDNVDMTFTQLIRDMSGISPNLTTLIIGRINRRGIDLSDTILTKNLFSTFENGSPLELNMANTYLYYIKPGFSQYIPHIETLNLSKTNSFNAHAILVDMFLQLPRLRLIDLSGFTFSKNWQRHGHFQY